MSENKLPEKYTPPSLERVGKLIEIGNKLSKTNVFGSFTDSRNGKTYKTVKIGTQTWMAENLAYKVESGCWAYNNDESNVAPYGYLYDWETAKKICPYGWHLPSDDEWQILNDCLGVGGYDYVGGKLKSTSEWKSPNIGATNESGFSALPGGFRNEDGAFKYVRWDGYWWSSTEYDSISALSRNLYFFKASVIWSSSDKDWGLSVRCVKDE